MKKKSNSSQPIFIVGMSRSGTTLISSMVSAHPNITIPHSETKFLCQWVKSYWNQDGKCPENFELFWEEYIKSERFSYLGVDADAALARILATCSYDYETIFTSVMQEYAIKMKKPRWGEKTPAHSRFVSVLFEWYPHARVLWMLRDPRAVVASQLATPWTLDVRTHATKWRNNVLCFEQWANDKRVLMVKYERLVAEPEQTLRQVCQFIDEEYTPTMIVNRSASTSPIINRSGWDLDHLKNVLKPITKASLDKWCSTLSSEQISEVELITRDKMLENGYQPVMSEVNYTIKLFLIKAWRKVTRLKALTLSFGKL